MVEWTKVHDSTSGESESRAAMLQAVGVNYYKRYYSGSEWIKNMDATLSKNEPLISEPYRGILRNCQANQMKRLYIDKDWANQKILQGEQRIGERDFTQNWMN